MDEVAVMVSSMERPVRVRPVARIGQVMVIVSGVLVVIFVVVVAVVIAHLLRGSGRGLVRGFVA